MPMRQRNALLLLSLLVVCGLPYSAAGAPESYAQAHKAWCAESRYQNNSNRTLCADRTWCVAHFNDDWLSRLACDPFRTKADKTLQRWALSAAALDTAPLLDISEQRSSC